MAYHQRLLPAHTQLKTRYINCLLQRPGRPLIGNRQPGQGGDADPQIRDLRSQLLEAEATHFSKKNPSDRATITEAKPVAPSKRQLEAGPRQDGDAEEDLQAKRRRVLEETRDIDADSDDAENESSEEDRSDSKIYALRWHTELIISCQR